MDTVGLDSVYGFEESFIDASAANEYQCPICLLPCNKAVQTSCGHRFCEKCIKKVMTEGRSQCPIDNLELGPTDIYPDGQARKQIQLLLVHCRSYIGHGCEWVGHLSLLKEHLTECRFTSIPCPEKCGSFLIRGDLEQHRARQCERRVVACPHCDLKVVWRFLEEYHFKQCPKLLIQCPNGCGEVCRGELARHLDNICEKSLVKCPFRVVGCDFEGTREELGNHEKVSETEHYGKMLNIVQTLKSTCDYHSTLLNCGGGSSKSEDTSGNLAEKVDDLEEDMHQLRETDMMRLRSEIIQIRLKCQDNQRNMNDVRSKMWNGRVFWKVENFEKCFQDAKEENSPAVHSFSFYTGIPGYKMYIRINPFGVEEGEGTHISMFVHLEEGEYDNIIEWPMSGKIILTILDQSECQERKDVTRTLTCKPTIQAFQKPARLKNSKGYGFDEMLSHQDLRCGSYVRNDSMLIKIEFHNNNLQVGAAEASVN